MVLSRQSFPIEVVRTAEIRARQSAIVASSFYFDAGIEKNSEKFKGGTSVVASRCWHSPIRKCSQILIA